VFLIFARIAVSSFGGASFRMRRILIEEKHWLTDREYVEPLALSQIRPTFARLLRTRVNPLY